MEAGEDDQPEFYRIDHGGFVLVRWLGWVSVRRKRIEEELYVRSIKIALQGIAIGIHQIMRKEE